MDKAKIISTLVSQMEAGLHRRIAAAEDAHAAATDEQARSENKYDTRGLESSYLARGHVMQLEDLAEEVQLLKGFKPADFSNGKPAASGALLEVELNQNRFFFLLLPCGGGEDVVVDGTEITIVTPHTPLGEQLTGKTPGDTYRVRPGAPVGKIVSVE